MINLDFDSLPDRHQGSGRDLTGYLDEDGRLRLCVTRLAGALANTLGNQQGPEYAAKLRELGAMAREVGELCEKRAGEVDYIDGPQV